MRRSIRTCILVLFCLLFTSAPAAAETENLPDPEVTFTYLTAGDTDGTGKAGCDISVTVKADDRADYVELRSGGMYLLGLDSIRIDKPAGGWGDGVTAVIPGWSVPRENKYTVFYSAFEKSTGEESETGKAELRISGEETAAPDIECPDTLSDWSRTISFTVAEVENIVVSREIRSVDLKRLYYSEPVISDNCRYEYTLNTKELGDYTGPFTLHLYVSAYKDGHWSACYTDSIEYTLPLPEPDVILPETLEAGEPVTAAIKGQENVTFYSYDFVSETVSESGSSSAECGKAEALPMGLDADTYTVTVTSRGISKCYAEAQKAMTLTVTGRRPEIAAPHLTLPEDKRILYTWANVVLEAEADMICYGQTHYVSSAGKFTIPVYLTPDGDSDTMTMTCRAGVNGRWTNAMDLKITGLHKAESSGGESSDSPGLTILSMPETAGLGESVPVRIQLRKDADSYTYSIAFCDNEDFPTAIVYEVEFQPDENGNFTIPSWYFVKPGKYDIGVNAYSHLSGACIYNQGYVTFTEPEGGLAAAPTVEMITENPKAYADVEFRITTGGAEKLIILVSDTEFGHIGGPIVVDTKGADPCTWVFNKKYYVNWPNYSFTMMASAIKNGVPSQYSDPVICKMRAVGREKQFPEECKVDCTNPEPGQTVTVSWPTLEGAEQYIVSANGYRNKAYTNIFIAETDAEANSCKVDLTGFDPGAIGIVVEGITPGKVGGRTECDVLLRDESRKPVLSLESAVCRPDKPIHVIAASSGGEEIFLYVNDEFFAATVREDSGKQIISIPLTEPGKYSITADTLGDETIWSSISDALEVEVNWVPDIVLPADTVSIGAEAFKDVKNKVVFLPASVKEIAQDAFDASIVILAPKDSYAWKTCTEYGLRCHEGRF